MTAKRIAPLLLVVLATALAALIAAAAAPSAAPHQQRVGERVNVFLGSPTHFPAGEPFHVAHGWGGIASDSSDYEAVGKYTFVLEVDGVVRKPDFHRSVGDTVVGRLARSPRCRSPAQLSRRAYRYAHVRRSLVRTVPDPRGQRVDRHVRESHAGGRGDGSHADREVP